MTSSTPTLTVVEREMPSFTYERALYVAQDDPLSARAVNRWRMSGTLPRDLQVKTSNLIPEGYGFFSFGNGSGQILVFESEEIAHA